MSCVHILLSPAHNEENFLKFIRTLGKKKIQRFSDRWCVTIFVSKITTRTLYFSAKWIVCARDEQFMLYNNIVTFIAFEMFVFTRLRNYCVQAGKRFAPRRPKRIASGPGTTVHGRESHRKPLKWNATGMRQNNIF